MVTPGPFPSQAETEVVIVVSGGDPPHPAVADHLPGGAYVIGADSGLDHARALGLRVDLVVGDMDSVEPGALALAEAAGALVERHAAAKDQTDLELALDRARDRRPGRVVVIGGSGGRLDHLLGTVSALAADRYANLSVEAWLGRAFVSVVRAGAELRGEPGGIVTLVPVHGPALGVTTEGLRYPLADEDLVPGTTRGVSNELVTSTARVRVQGGVLLAIQPDALGA